VLCLSLAFGLQGCKAVSTYNNNNNNNNNNDYNNNNIHPHGDGWHKGVFDAKIKRPSNVIIYNIT
jgi:hypothetical protein